MELQKYDLALIFCDRALEQKPDDEDIIETKGTINLENGNMEKAFAVSFYLYFV